MAGKVQCMIIPKSQGDKFTSVATSIQSSTTILVTNWWNSWYLDLGYMTRESVQKCESLTQVIQIALTGKSLYTDPVLALNQAMCSTLHVPEQHKGWPRLCVDSLGRTHLGYFPHSDNDQYACKSHAYQPCPCRALVAVLCIYGQWLFNSIWPVGSNMIACILLAWSQMDHWADRRL